MDNIAQTWKTMRLTVMVRMTRMRSIMSSNVSMDKETTSLSECPKGQISVQPMTEDFLSSGKL